METTVFRAHYLTHEKALTADKSTPRTIQPNWFLLSGLANGVLSIKHLLPRSSCKS